MEEEKKPLKAATEPPNKQVQEIEEESRVNEEPPSKSSGGGWGGWGFSAFSVLSDLQKAAEEISRNVCVLYLSLLLVQHCCNCVTIRLWKLLGYWTLGS